jgi:membrane protein DedA with SNARE-associated domain
MPQLASHVAGVDFASLAQLFQLLSLFALPFAHADVAIVLGGYIVVNDLMPAGLVLLSIYGGIVGSDFALYGIGAGARRIPWLARHAVDDRVQGFSDMLKRNAFALVALSRLIPGLRFVAGVACGWRQVSFARFTIASLFVSALYVPLVLYLVVVFGDALDDHIGLWAWPALLAMLAGTAFARRQILPFQGTVAGSSEEASRLPPLDTDGRAILAAPAGVARRVAPIERIPRVLLRIALVLHRVALGLRYRSVTLPSAVNPGFDASLAGGPKSELLRAVVGEPRALIAEFVVMRRRADPTPIDFDHARALRLLADAGLRFPLVAKPDIGRDGVGVRLIRDAAALKAYLAGFPTGAKLILQRYVGAAGEATALVTRRPGHQAWMVSLTLRHCAHVVGDGVSTVRTLIARDARARRHAGFHLGHDAGHLGCERATLDRVPARGEPVPLALIASRRAGALSCDASAALTPALTEKLAAVAGAIPDFHCGFLDLRFRSLEALMRGEVCVIGIGGAEGDPEAAFDPALPLREAVRRLLAHQRLLFAIGECNRADGAAPVPLGECLSALLQHADLIGRYPASS